MLAVRSATAPVASPDGLGAILTPATRTTQQASAPRWRSRTPRWWAEGDEPDYRFTLANERTFLAWIRTSLALIGGAVALSGFAADLGTPVVTAALATVSAATGAVLAIGAYRRWAEVQRAMRNGLGLPPPSLIRLVSALIATAAIASLIIALA
jgi:putative membrane protein